MHQELIATTFEESQIRRVWDEEGEQWYFAIIDIVDTLFSSTNPRRYWSDLKRKLKREGSTQLYENIVQLKMKAKGRRMRQNECANVKGIFRLFRR